LAHKVNTIILDKTGTITEGNPIVTDITWSNNADQEKLNSILFEIERKSEHPLAEAVVEKLQSNKSEPLSIDNFQSITGRGVAAKVQNDSYLVGNKQLILEHKIDIEPEIEKDVNKFQQEGKTVIFFANEKNVLAIIAIADKIKSTSKNAIQKLQNRGITVYMLTGDNRQTAEAVAQQVGLQNYKAEVTPSDKADFVKKLQQKGLVVAMVGDGINDSQALAQADVSIAMGKGSDIAIDVAKITLITSDLNLISKALALSKQTVATVKQNLFWAFVYNLIGIPLAAGALFAFNGFLLNPIIAAAAMAFSSVSVVLNSLRLKWEPLSN
jgi:Cu2+-exporting ATPase